MAQENSIPILPYKLVGGINAAVAPIAAVAEHSGDSQLIGTPCNVASGFVVERTAIDDGTKMIAGFTGEFGHNLTTSGVPQFLTYGAVQLQPNAKNIPMGAPLSFGTMSFYIANDHVWFKAKTDDAHTLAQSDVDTIYGLTKDTTCNFWYVDTTITAVNSGACVVVTELIDPIGTVGGLVAFRVAKVRQQYGN